MKFDDDIHMLSPYTLRTLLFEGRKWISFHFYSSLRSGISISISAHSAQQSRNLYEHQFCSRGTRI